MAGGVVEPRDRGGGRIYGPLAREALDHVSIAMAEHGRIPPYAGLVVPDPEDRAKGRSAGHGEVAGLLEKLLLPHHLPDLPGLPVGTAVEKEDGGAESLPVLGHGYEPRCRHGERDHADRGESTPEFPATFLKGAPPLLRLDVRLALVVEIHLVEPRGLAFLVQIRPENAQLEGRGPHVDGEYVPHQGELLFTVLWPPSDIHG